MKEKIQSTMSSNLVQKGNKPTLVIGASTNPRRYSFRAIHMLRDHDIPVYALGLREGEVGDVGIARDREAFLGKDIHTITLYMNPYRQEEYYDYIISLKPKRVIFNPGTENHILADMLRKEGIEPLEACTLVMLSLNQF